jgi:hypothetical protein
VSQVYRSRVEEVDGKRAPGGEPRKEESVYTSCVGGGGVSSGYVTPCVDKAFAWAGNRRGPVMEALPIGERVKFVHDVLGNPGAGQDIALNILVGGNAHGIDG